jgi:hypothetical protein
MRFIKNTLFLLLLVSCSYSFSQPYKTALGLRLGFPSWANFNVKHNFGPHWSIDAGIGGGYRYAGIDVAGEYNFDISSVQGMRWYLGASIDVGALWWGGVGYYHGYYYGHNADLALGTSFFGGIEYTFPNIPLNLCLDIGPRIPILPVLGYNNSWIRGTTSVRYTFK